MAYVVVASVRSSFTPSDGDCTVIQSLVVLLSWTQVNDRAASAITTAKFFPLTTPYFKRVIDQLGSVVCGGSRALGDTAFLIGQGSSLQSVNDWVQTYSSDEFVLKYFTSNTVTALNSLAKGTLLQQLNVKTGLSCACPSAPTGDLDFALGVKAGYCLPPSSSRFRFFVFLACSPSLMPSFLRPGSVWRDWSKCKSLRGSHLACFPFTTYITQPLF
jgi:hypothetical protein